MAERLLAIVGPTATGKTEVGVLLAEALGGEIVSADSMQVYRGMDIGTAKPTAEQRARVRHHLIDIVDPDELFSVADYRKRADAALEDIWGRGRQPILVGGSGLYVRAVLEEMDFSEVPPDPELRRRLTAEARSKGTRALHEWLSEVDPEAAARIHPNDEKRIIRALEVSESVGGGGPPPRKLDRRRRVRYNTRQFGLNVAREELYRRIEARVDGMIARGLVEEVRGLLERGYGKGLVAMKGLGYGQLAPHVQGEVSLEEAVRRLKRDTRRFAKRQLTWFRADERVEWVDVMEAGGVAGAVEQIRRRWEEQ
ncbi:MAG: tRNA (adenosine(37)-N6)-dimethylallyltransferase MiaA [Armatimonadota bacterium]|nr:MAG: tRNA (adenosine(37)-N6)-dimethylallyltransferase MiaA [Armatimonadota bacterium]